MFKLIRTERNIFLKKLNKNQMLFAYDLNLQNMLSICNGRMETSANLVFGIYVRRN